MDTAAARLHWIDTAKAVAILLVVFGHASRSIERTDGLVWPDWLRFADTLIYSFHIPLFLILAGFTASLHRGRPVAEQARALFWGLFVPYAVWTVIWVGLKMSFPGSVNTPLGLSDLLTALWRPVEHMWFLQHLLIARLLWMAMDGITGERRWLSLGSLVIFLMLLDCALMTGTPHAETSLGYILGNAGLFGAGRIWLPRVLESRNQPWIIAAAAGLAALWLLLELTLSPPDSSILGEIAALSISFAILIVISRQPAPSNLPARLFAFLGEASLAIYLMHPIIIGLVRSLLAKFATLDETSLLVAGTILGVLLPALAYALLLSLAARSGSPILRWIGLGTATRSHYLWFASPAPAAAIMKS